MENNKLLKYLVLVIVLFPILIIFIFMNVEEMSFNIIQNPAAILLILWYYVEIILLLMISSLFLPVIVSGIISSILGGYWIRFTWIPITILICFGIFLEIYQIRWIIGKIKDRDLIKRRDIFILISIIIISMFLSAGAFMNLNNILVY